MCRLLLVNKMNHDHDHAAMLASATSTNHGNHPTVGQGLHMMMMAVSNILQEMIFFRSILDDISWWL